MIYKNRLICIANHKTGVDIIVYHSRPAPLRFSNIFVTLDHSTYTTISSIEYNMFMQYDQFSTVSLLLTIIILSTYTRTI